MTTLILGIGIGLFVITSLWFFAILLFLLSLKIDKRIGFVILVIAGIITIILISVPRTPENPKLYEDKPYDSLFIWRLILLTLIVTSSIVGLFGYVKYELMELVQPIRIRAWIF